MPRHFLDLTAAQHDALRRMVLNVMGNYPAVEAYIKAEGTNRPAEQEVCEDALSETFGYSRRTVRTSLDALRMGYATLRSPNAEIFLTLQAAFDRALRDSLAVSFVEHISVYVTEPTGEDGHRVLAHCATINTRFHPLDARTLWHGYVLPYWTRGTYPFTAREWHNWDPVPRGRIWTVMEAACASTPPGWRRTTEFDGFRESQRLSLIAPRLYRFERDF